MRRLPYKYNRVTIRSVWFQKPLTADRFAYTIDYASQLGLFYPPDCS
jgi:hypothetical protein